MSQLSFRCCVGFAKLSVDLSWNYISQSSLPCMVGGGVGQKRYLQEAEGRSERCRGPGWGWSGTAAAHGQLLICWSTLLAWHSAMLRLLPDPASASLTARPRRLPSGRNSVESQGCSFCIFYIPSIFLGKASSPYQYAYLVIPVSQS